MLKIRVFENAQSFFEKEFPEGADIKVGRSEQCDLVLRSKRVSREHCRIYLQAGHWLAEDLNSQNGIRLNGDKIHSEKLNVGDNLQIGDFRLEIMRAGDASEGPKPPDTDDRTVLLSSIDADDLTVVRSINFADDQKPDTVAAKIIQPFFKNKILMMSVFGLVLILLIAVLLSMPSKDTQDPEHTLLPAEQKKTEAMIDMESQHRMRLYLQSGQEQFDAGNFNEALVRFQAVLKIDPENETALAYIGQCREKIIEIEEQRREAAEEQKMRMERVATITSRARQSFQRSDYASALEIITEAAFLAPQDPSVSALKTEIETALENEQIKKEKAILQSKKTLAELKQHFDKGQQFYDQGKYHDALQEWEQVLASGMETPETSHVRHAIVHIKTLLEENIRQDYEKGKTAFNNKDYTRSVAYLQKVSQVLPDYQDTEQLLKDAVSELETQARRLFQEGLVYEGIGQNQKAAAKWREVLKIMPLESNEYYQRSLDKLQ